MSKFRILQSSVALALLASSFAACGGTSPQGEIEAETAPIVTTATTVELVAVEDARTQLRSGDVNFGGDIKLWTNVTDAHYSFVKFDLAALPAGAVIESAELRLYFNTHYAGANTTELGRVEEPWEESTITWNTQPAITWEGPTAPVGDEAGDITFDVTGLVAKWHGGERPNYGFALHSLQNGGKQYWSRESPTEFPPRLVITYSFPEPPGPRPDLGDAPDSTNPFAVPNTAYPFTGVLGQFPTVFPVPANVPAGPRHANATVQAFLGQFMSGEPQAHVGPDQDGVNNILHDPVNGMVGDFSDNDRGDDGWRNRGIRFEDCETRTLQVRVSKPLGATRPLMFLNVWFDGVRDGDWNDTALCTPPGGGAAQPSYEWIVQNSVINMNAVPAGGFTDFPVNTVRVLNATLGLPHWMRFTLSDTPAVTPPVGPPDGRGPHPMNRPEGFEFGETEDVFQLPPPPPPPPSLLEPL